MTAQHRGVTVKPASSADEAHAYMTGGERFWYIILCIVTFGWIYFRKIMVKKATLEALLLHDRIVAQRAAYLPPIPSAPAYATEVQRGMYPQG